MKIITMYITALFASNLYNKTKDPVEKKHLNSIVLGFNRGQHFINNDEKKSYSVIQLEDKKNEDNSKA